MLSNKIKTKKAFHWVIELAIWFLIFIVLANVILFIKAKHDMAYNTYQIFMPDVDGVIVGSAIVKMIGENGKSSIEKVGEYVKLMKAGISE